MQAREFITIAFKVRVVVRNSKSAQDENIYAYNVKVMLIKYLNCIINYRLIWQIINFYLDFIESIYASASDRNINAIYDKTIWDMWDYQIKRGGLVIYAPADVKIVN